MYRFAIEDLKRWKNKINRKPLILFGARQVGKTWIMEEFGKTCFKNYLYINFDYDKNSKIAFEKDLDPHRIIKELCIINEFKITEDTLFIFDEIQEYPQALSSLKYFCELAPEYHIICAGSFMGIAKHQGTNFPVGKVDIQNIYPMTYNEFLMASGKENYYGFIENKEFDTVQRYKDIYIKSLKEYFFVGGMPEVVSEFVESNDYYIANEIQQKILNNYENDFSKHAQSNQIVNLIDTWHSLPRHLAKENKKFKYKEINEKAKGEQYSYSLKWLEHCGLINKINKVSAHRVPLKPYFEENIFKIYINDIGLLSCMSNLSPKTILLGDDIFMEFKGALTEQFVCQELTALGEITLAYYSNDRNKAEVDFLGDYLGSVFPIEVKANINTKAKSLKVYMDKFNPEFALRFSLKDYNRNKELIDIPLYLISNYKYFLEKEFAVKKIERI